MPEMCLQVSKLLGNFSPAAASTTAFWTVQLKVDQTTGTIKYNLLLDEQQTSYNITIFS
jgi:hypothetical protein